ncbi:tyrosine-type recombinase/integrase [Catellatospora chokoriensis]|uniref:Site-specific integrase n=1 Tax=Catellatospora chokoriensis TaxID=310353 RepID=A0A8J3NX12_9ACTN|nr:site-specific integrase [Catellatospora chokoriensis]GIF93830.1 site-specific integrase [Catellatospora chokoriensis]
MPRKRAEGTRAPNMAATIYQGNDGRWHGRVTMGTLDNGKPDRRHVSAKTEAEVLQKVRGLERDRDAGRVVRPGKGWTVEKWLNHWLEHIAAPTVRANTLSGYRVAVRVHLIPGVGAHRLDRLTAEHLEKLYARMQASGSAAATAHQAHRTIRAALNQAVKRQYLARNPATYATAPQLDEEEVEPYTIEEVQRFLAEAGKHRNSARWAIALALGLRQGEVLGLQWPDLDLDRGELRVRRSRLRPTYAHGCGGTCGRSPGYCPQKRQTNAATDKTKSRAGRRRVGLPAELVELLEAHRQEQDKERITAAQLWHDEGWVFASHTGRPLSPNTDYREWKRLLAAAGLRDGRLHDARHTAATVLLILGVQQRAVMGLMGWSSAGMAARYQHVTDSIRRDVADQIGGAIWKRTSEQERRTGDEGDDGTSAVPALV